VESYDAALKAMEAGEYTPELAAELKEKLSTVFNRGFWEGYYAGRDIAEHTARYGSSATQRKVYIGKVTNFFKKISVAEVLVEAAPVNRGDQLLWMGETTGVLEMEAEGLVLKEQVVDHIPQGTYFSIKMPQTLRRGDKLYKMVPSEEVDQQFDNV
jgi:putative protease